MNEVKLSIGIPTYNQGAYISKTIDSLLNQNQAPFELVVSNNHSTDNTEDILTQYQGKIKVIKPEKFLTMAQHFNFLASNLTGNWFSLLSSDDIAKPNFVRTLINGAERSKNAVFIRSGWDRIDGDGQFLERRYLLRLKKVTSPPETFYEQVRGPNVSFAAYALRRSTWEQVGGFPEDCLHLVDWAMWLKCANYGDFIYEHDIIGEFRTAYRPESDRKKLFMQLRDSAYLYTTVIPNILDSMPNPDVHRVQKASKTRLINYVACFSRILSEEERSETADIMREWAQQSGCEKLLQEFLRGKIWADRKMLSSIKRSVRNVYQSVFA